MIIIISEVKPHHATIYSIKYTAIQQHKPDINGMKESHDIFPEEYIKKSTHSMTTAANLCMFCSCCDTISEKAQYIPKKKEKNEKENEISHC